MTTKNSPWSCREKHQQHSVFLSYRANPDFALAESVAHALRAKGLSVFFDKHCLNPGQQWIVDIFNGLQTSKVIAVVITEDMLEGIEQAHQSLDNVLLEIEMALKLSEEGKCKLLPLLFGKYTEVELRQGVKKTVFVPFSSFSDAPFSGLKPIHPKSLHTHSVREIMQRLFQLQGVPSNPHDIASVVSTIQVQLPPAGPIQVTFPGPCQAEIPFLGNTTKAICKLWGGGGSGGGGWHVGNCNKNAGGGGGAGGYTEVTIPRLAPDQKLLILAGCGGTGAVGCGDDGQASSISCDGAVLAHAGGGHAGHAYGSAPTPRDGQGGAGNSAPGEPGACGMTYAAYMAQVPVRAYCGPVGKGGDAMCGGCGGLGGWNQAGHDGAAPGGGGGGGTAAIGASGAPGKIFIEFV